MGPSLDHKLGLLMDRRLGPWKGRVWDHTLGPKMDPLLGRMWDQLMGQPSIINTDENQYKICHSNFLYKINFVFETFPVV